MKIGIYSGSFNPVHIGHVALADYIIRQGIVDEIWMIRSPQNPLKVSSSLLSDGHRAKMLEIAIKDHKGLRMSTIEDTLPRPNYTINTLIALKEQNPFDDFYLIIGADNWLIFDKWRDWEKILSDFHLIVYPRPGYEMPEIDTVKYPTVQYVDAPQYDISSTEIRKLISDNQSVEDLISPEVDKYIKENNLYGII